MSSVNKRLKIARAILGRVADQTEWKIKIRHEPVFHVIVDDLFGSTINRQIFRHIISLEKHFEQAQITDKGLYARNVRSNAVCMIDDLFDRPEFGGPDEKKDWPKIRAFRAAKSPLLKAVDYMMQSESMRTTMDSAPFPLCKFRQMDTWETQISRYGKGQSYTWHHDRGPEDKDKRIVTMNYYVSSLPRKFYGGELCLSSGDA